MRLFRFTTRQFWITAAAAGGAGVAVAWLAAEAGIDPMYPGGLGAGLGAAIAFVALGIRPDSESQR